MIELLCIETHPQLLVVAGNIYPLIKDGGPCSCTKDSVDVGIKTHSVFTMEGAPYTPKVGERVRCGRCGDQYLHDGLNIHWFYRSRFVQIGEKDEHETYQKKEEPATV